MIDNFALLFSTLLVVFVVLRAVILNRTIPWYEVAPEERPISRPARRSDSDEDDPWPRARR